MTTEKERRAAEAAETVNIIDARGYAVGDHPIDLSEPISEQIAGTVFYPQDRLLFTTATKRPAADIRTTEDDAITAVLKRGDADGEVYCLVFASARRPGGGFLGGANAQEESIVRASTLYASQRDSEFYEIHKRIKDVSYTDAILYVPHARVIRYADGPLLTKPVACTFAVAAAPNAGSMNTSQPHDLHKVPMTIERRIDRVLDLAAQHGHRHLVLGAWGCGVFGNDATMVANTFKRSLDERPWFDSVTFAVPNPISIHHKTFAKIFGV